MAWRIAGSFVSHCNCQQVCGCAWDQPPTFSNAPFGFAPVFKIGKSSGRSGLFGKEFDANYGEAAEYEFSTEPTA